MSIGTIAWTIIALSGAVFVVVITVIVLSLKSKVDGTGD